MRASAPSASSTATALLPIAEGNGAVGASSPAATDRARAGADRSFDPSHGERPDQPFAAALAGAQAGNAQENAGKAEAINATGKSTSDADPKPAAAAEALLEPRIGATVAASMRDVADAVAAGVIAAASVLTDEHEGPTAPTKSSDARDATHNAGASGRTKSVKHPEPAPPITATPLDGGALAATAALLSASSAQISTPRATQASVTSAPRSNGNTASVGNTAAAAVSMAEKHLALRAATADVAAARDSSYNLSGPDHALDASDPKGGSASSSPVGRAPDATAHGAAAGSGLAPVMQSLSSVAHASVPNAPSAIRVPVSDPHWPNAVAAQVQWMASRQVQSATLRLSPEHLGPLEVRIDVTHSQINVNFNAHHPDTREALAQAVPRLRELFAANGLNLGEATVRQEAHSSGPPLQSQPSGVTPAAETVEPVANTAIQRIGLVDEYA